MGSIWTDELIEELTRLWYTPLSASQIGLKLGVNKNCVIGKARRLALTPRKSPIKTSK